MTTSAPPPRRLARRALRAAAWALRPEAAPTGELVTVAEPDAAHVRRTLDLALRVAEALLGSGASANDTTDVALRLTRAFGVRGVHVDVTFTSIGISWHRGDDVDPVSVLRVVRARGIDYTRLQRLEALVAACEHGLTVAEARTRLARVLRAPSQYRRWVVVAASGLLAGGVCLLYASSVVVAVVAVVASCLVDLLQGALLRRGMPAFFVQALGAAVPAAAAVGLFVGVQQGVPGLEEVRPSLVVASGIVLLLSGLSTVGAAQDAIDGFYVTAAARSFEVMMMTLGIVTGILGVLHLAGRLGVDFFVSTVSPAMAPVPLQLLGALLVSLAFAVSTGAGPRSALLCSLMGLLGYGTAFAATSAGFGAIGASAIGATSAGVLGTLLSTRLAIPSLALTTSAVVPLMPGSMVFRGLLQLIAPDAGTTALAQALITLLNAASIGVALAAGVSLGTYLVRPVARRRTRAPQQVRGVQATPGRH